MSSSSKILPTSTDNEAGSTVSVLNPAAQVVVDIETGPANTPSTGKPNAPILSGLPPSRRRSSLGIADEVEEEEVVSAQ